MLTIDDMIRRLEKARKASPLGGDTVVHLCKNGVPYKPITQVKLASLGDGAVLLLKAQAARKRKVAAKAPEWPTWAKICSQDQYGTWADLTVGGVVQRMRWIPPGTFTMGSPSSEADRATDETPHQVTLTRGYWLADSECTQGVWQTVMGNNPSRFKGDWNLPVENVSWDDVQGFVKTLNGRIGGGPLRLPTEAEWEYACRAGSIGAYAGDLSEMAWYDYNSEGKTCAVRTKRANAWGLYDMHGNVWEWCQDWYRGYSRSAERDPTGPSSGSYRVLRGGCWNFDARFCRSACRLRYSPDFRYSFLGFRLAASV